MMSKSKVIVTSTPNMPEHKVFDESFYHKQIWFPSEDEGNDIDWSGVFDIMKDYDFLYPFTLLMTIVDEVAKDFNKFLSIFKTKEETEYEYDIMSIMKYKAGYVYKEYNDKMMSKIFTYDLLQQEGFADSKIIPGNYMDLIKEPYMQLKMAEFDNLNKKK